MNLARQMPLLSRFGSQPRLAEDASRHYAEAARRTLALIAEDGDLADTVAAALRHLDNDAVRLGLLLGEMLARRDQWLRHALAAPSRAEAEDGFAQLIGRELERAAAAIDARRQAALMPAARYAAANLPPESPLAPLLEWTAPLPPRADALPQWRALAALLLTGEGEARKLWNKNLGLPPGKDSDVHKKALAAVAQELAADAAAALARVRELPAPRYTDEEWITVEALGALLKVAAGQLWTVFNEAGETDFIEVARRALQALGTSDAPTDLALALDYRIRHLLVDEFQDTSPTQVELLERLTAGWTMDEKAGEGRTLFAVGDPMQSIYRFRKADVGLFLRVADLGIGGAGTAARALAAGAQQPLRARRRRLDQRALRRHLPAAGQRVRRGDPLPPLRGDTAGQCGRRRVRASARRGEGHAGCRCRRARSGAHRRADRGGEARRPAGANRRAGPGAQPPRCAGGDAAVAAAGLALPGRRNRSAAVAPDGPGPAVAGARAASSRRPRALAGDPARALVRTDARRSPQPGRRRPSFHPVAADGRR